jgi:hypothetical protein
MENSFQKKIGLWVFGLAFGMICLGCASTSPKPEALAPSLKPAPAPQETMPPPAQTISTPRETHPARFEPVPAPSKPDRREPAPKATVEAKPKATEDSYVHTVKWNGETVSLIAGWYTGNTENWKALAQANPNIKANRIFAGNKILIPKTLLKTREPMPKEFVDRFYSKPKKEKAQAKPQPQLTQTQEEELTLVGPKKSPKK